MGKKFLLNLVKVGVSVALLLFLLYNINLSKLVDIILNINLITFIVLISFGVIIESLSIYRIKLLLLYRQVNIPIKKITNIYFRGLFYSNFLPSIIGGDVPKAILLMKDEPKKKAKICYCCVLDRVYGLVSIVLVLLIGILLNGMNYFASFDIEMERVYTYLGIIAFALVTIVGILYLYRINIYKIMVSNISWILDDLLYKPGSNIIALVLSITYQMLIILIVYLFNLSLLPNPVSFANFMLITPLVTLIVVLPISINGIGIRENVYGLLLQLSGVSYEYGVALSLMMYCILIVESLMGFFLSV